MTSREVEPQGPRPVAMGCTLFVLAILVGVVAVGGCIAFAESGANSGKMTLRDADSYDIGSFEFVSESNFFLTRTPAGQFYALSNLDAANRLEGSGQCRVNLVNPADPAQKTLSTQYKPRFSAEAGGEELIFREACFNAAYDMAGVRLDTDGRNLDQFKVTVDKQNRVVVDVTRRICTSRQGATVRVNTTC